MTKLRQRSYLDEKINWSKVLNNYLGGWYPGMSTEKIKADIKTMKGKRPKGIAPGSIDKDKEYLYWILALSQKAESLASSISGTLEKTRKTYERGSNVSLNVLKSKKRALSDLVDHLTNTLGVARSI